MTQIFLLLLLLPTIAIAHDPRFETFNEFNSFDYNQDPANFPVKDKNYKFTQFDVGNFIFSDGLFYLINTTKNGEALLYHKYRSHDLPDEWSLCGRIDGSFICINNKGLTRED